MRKTTDSQNPEMDRSASAPVSPRRVSQRASRGVTKSSTEDFPVLIRLPDIGRKTKGRAVTFVADRHQESITVPLTHGAGSIPEPPRMMPQDESASGPENTSEGTTIVEPSATTESSRQNRRRRRVPEPQPASWKEIAVQWGIIFGIVVAVASVFHLLTSKSNSNSATPPAIAVPEVIVETEPEPASPTRDEPTLATESSQTESQNNAEPTPAIAPPPATPSTPDVTTGINADNTIPVEPPVPTVAEPDTAFETTSRYPTTNPNNYLYRPGSTSRGEIPNDPNARFDGQMLNSGASNRFPAERAIIDDSVRTARLRGITSPNTQGNR